MVQVATRWVCLCFWNVTFADNWVAPSSSQYHFSNVTSMKKDAGGAQPHNLHQNYIYKASGGKREAAKCRQRCWQSTNDFLHPLTLNILSLHMNNALSCDLGGKAEFTKKHLVFFPFCAAQTHTQQSFLMLLQFCFCLHSTLSTFPFVEGHAFCCISCVFITTSCVLFFWRHFFFFPTLLGETFARTCWSLKQSALCDANEILFCCRTTKVWDG